MQFPASLNDSRFRRYSIGSLFALCGMWGQRTVLAWLSWDLTGAAFWVGVVAFCAFAPTILFSPFFGVFADRTDLKRATLLVQVFQAGISIVGLALYLVGWLTIWPLAALALTYGIVMSAHHPVRMALTPLLVPKPDLPNAIAVTSMTFNLARLLGPAIAGAVIAGYGVAPAMALTIITILSLIWVIAGLYPRASDAPPRSHVGVIAALTEGIGIVVTRRIIRLSMMLTAVFTLIVRGVLELLPTIADGVFQRGADGLGQLMAATGAGALCAAILIASRAAPDANTLPRSAVVAIFCGFAATFAIGLSGTWPATLIVVAIGGFCSTYVGVTLQSTVQMRIRDGERGRVMSLWSLVAIGGAAIGALLMGAAADVVGTGGALIFAAAFGTIGASTIIAADFWRERRLS